MAIMTVPAMAVVITITTAITVGKDVAIATDVVIALVVVSVTVAMTVSMKVIVDHQEQARSCVTKIPVDNNKNNYFSYNSQTNIFYFSIYIS